jgi:hypothetical protein
LALNEGVNMDNKELLQLAYIKVAKAAQLLQMAGEEPLAEEAEALADKVDRATAHPSPVEVQVNRTGGTTDPNEC